MMHKCKRDWRWNIAEKFKRMQNEELIAAQVKVSNNEAEYEALIGGFNLA